MVIRCGSHPDVVLARRVVSRTVAEPRRAPGLVKGDPAFHVVTQGSRDDFDVGRVGLGRLAYHPSATIFERLGQVPVVQGQCGLDVTITQSVDESAIEVKAGLVDLTRTTREDARPRHRE